MKPTPESVLREVQGQQEREFLDEDVEPGAKYLYMVRAKCGTVFGAWSRHVTVSSVSCRSHSRHAMTQR